MASATEGLEVLKVRMDHLEKDVQDLESSSVKEGFFNAKLETVRAEMNVLKARADSLAEQITASAAEDTQKRLLIYGAILAAVGSLVVSIVMGG